MRRKFWQWLSRFLYSRRRLRELYESAMTISEQRRRRLESLQSMHEDLVASFEETSSELAVLHVEHSRLREKAARLRDALTSLSGCMPDRVYVYGDEGQFWCGIEPDESQFPEYETIDFAELLGAGAESNACQ